MKILFRTFLFTLLLFASSGIYAQITTTGTDKVYGLDPLLFNGKYYTYFLPAGTGGTQFFGGSEFEKGLVVIRGVTYENLLLKYDVFNQQLILQYKTNSGADNQIVISDAWLESFNLGNTHFEMLAIQDSVKRIYQVLGSGPDRILYSWRKELTLDSRTGATNHVFSDSKKETYLLTGSRLLKYKNNRSFAALFIPSKQAALKKQLRLQRIKMQKASDWTINELINFCNTLSSK